MMNYGGIGNGKLFSRAKEIFRHQLSNIDQNKMFADCSICGRIPISKKSFYVSEDKIYKKFYVCNKLVSKEKRVDKLDLMGFPPIRENDKCSICGLIEFKMLTRDHDHISGSYRGVLCRKCNLGIGYFDDRTDLLLKAVNYLK